MRPWRVGPHVAEPSVEGDHDSTFDTSGFRHGRVALTAERLVDHGVEVTLPGV